MIDYAPDLALIRVLARGHGASWINIDADGHLYEETLPSYDDDGAITLPTETLARSMLSHVRATTRGVRMVLPNYDYLRMLEYGVTDLECAG